VRRQFSCYLGVGALATSVHYAILVGCVETVGWPAAWASGAGAVAGAQVAYAGNRWLTFAHAGRLSASWIRFQATALAGALLGMGLVYGLTQLGWHYLWAQLLATASALVLTFSINRIWTFR
jgi:putative flippase GtrA